MRGKLEYNTQGVCTNGREIYSLNGELAPTGERVIVLRYTLGACTNGRKIVVYTELAPRERKLE
jgi:hypothetical protein